MFLFLLYVGSKQIHTLWRSSFAQHCEQLSAQTGKPRSAQWPGFVQFLALPAQAGISQAAPF